MTLSLRFSIAGSLALAADLADVKGKFSGILSAMDFGQGSINAGDADAAFLDINTLAASGTVSHDLSGTLVGLFGGNVTFAKVKAIALLADAGNTHDVILGNVTNGFVGPFGAATHSIAVPPGGLAVLARPLGGWTVTAGTADLLKVLNGGAVTPVTYKLAVIGNAS